MVAIAGPNGAGKTTFYNMHIRQAGLRLVNVDDLARETGLGSIAAAKQAGGLRRELVRRRESFAFETVLAGAAGNFAWHHAAAEAGYHTILFYIGVSGAEVSGQRVAMRVSQGGHSVPEDRLIARYPQTLANLERAIRELPHVWVFDNDQLQTQFRLVAVFENGRLVTLHKPVPKWLKAV
jgi:predicted ABC-type ATPase